MLLFLLFLSSISAVYSQCSFESGDLSAKWQVVNGELTVQFINKNIGNNQWTAIAFGEGMDNLEVVLFGIENNKASLRTGFTTGYGPPTLDSSPNVAAERVMYNSNQLSTRFTRPIGANGSRQNNLQQCSTWNFVASGPYNNGNVGKHNQRPQSMRVCPQQCTSAFDKRDITTDPLPQAAVYNNRQSSRFDGLHGPY